MAAAPAVDVIGNTFKPVRRTRSVYRDRGGTRYHWVEAGSPDATPLVLLHGYMAHSMAFRRVAEPLAEHFRLIIPDLPAHGRDETYRHGAVRPTLESLADWLDHFRTEALAGAPAHWVGHSLGANVAYHIAREAPSKFLSMTMVSPGLRIPGSPVVSYALERLPATVATLGANKLGLSLYQPLNWRGAPMTPAEAREYLAPMRSRSRMKFILRLGARLLDGKHPSLQRLAVPTQVLWGRHDHILPLEDAYLVEEQLDAELHIVDESGHSPMEDTPDEFVDHMLDFLLRTK